MVMAAVVAALLQLYPVPPLAVSVVLLPGQILALVGLIAAPEPVFTTTVVLAVAVQPPASVTVTVYVPAMAFVAPAMVGFCSVELKLLGPLHEKPVPVEACSEIVPPTQ